MTNIEIQIASESDGLETPSPLSPGEFALREMPTSSHLVKMRRKERTNGLALTHCPPPEKRKSQNPQRRFLRCRRFRETAMGCKSRRARAAQQRQGHGVDLGMVYEFRVEGLGPFEAVEE